MDIDRLFTSRLTSEVDEGYGMRERSRFIGVVGLGRGVWGVRKKRQLNVYSFEL